MTVTQMEKRIRIVSVDRAETTRQQRGLSAVLLRKAQRRSRWWVSAHLPEAWLL